MSTSRFFSLALRLGAGAVLALSLYIALGRASLARLVENIPVLSEGYPVVIGIILLVFLLVAYGRPGTAYALSALLAGVSALYGELETRYFVLGLISSSILYTLAHRLEILSRSEGKYKIRCERRCILYTSGVLITTYVLVALGSVLGALWVKNLYDAILRAPKNLPEPLLELWRLVSQSITTRLLVALLLLGIFYYMTMRLASPIVYALTARREDLWARIVELLRKEAEAVSMRRKWYHKMLGSSLLLTGFIPEIMISMMVLILLITFANIDILSNSNAYAILAILSMPIGYAAAKYTIKMLTGSTNYWSKLVFASSLLLVAFIAYTVFSSPQGIDNIVEIFRAAIEGEPAPYTRLDLKLAPLLATYESYVYKLGRWIEHIARVIVELLWG